MRGGLESGTAAKLTEAELESRRRARARHRISTVDFTVKMVGRAYGTRLVARGELARSRSTPSTSAVEVFADTDNESPYALGLVTMRTPSMPMSGA